MGLVWEFWEARRAHAKQKLTQVFQTTTTTQLHMRGVIKQVVSDINHLKFIFKEKYDTLKFKKHILTEAHAIFLENWT